MASLDFAVSGCRLVQFTALMLLFGASGFVRMLGPSPLGYQVGRRLHRPLIVAAMLTLLATLLWPALQTGAIGDGWPSAVDPAQVATLLTHTGFGQIDMVRMLLAALLLPLAIWSRAARSGMLALGAGLLLGAFALTGHAAMHEGVAGWLQRLNHAAHLLCAGAWLGALLPFLLCLSTLSKPHEPAERAAAIKALQRFSRAGHVAVAGVLLSGVINVMLVLGRWPIDWSSPYQALLAAKIAVTAIMVGLALGNRYVLVPRMQRGPGASATALAAIRRRASVNLMLGVAAIALVSVFGMLSPN